jgi:arylsulfatase A-like enzyme
MDTAGAKHMSLYGYPRPTTPHLERLAEGATVYTRCFAPSSWTLPSHASLFTGLYPSEHRVEGVDVEKLILNPGFQHFMSILKQSGYDNYGISCNPLVSPAYGIIRDFDYFFEYESWQVKDKFNKIISENKKLTKLYKIFDKSLKNRRIHRMYYMFIYHLGFLFSKKVSIQKNSAPYTQRTLNNALEIILKHHKNKQKTPFFMFINVIENHSLYNPPKIIRKFSKKTDMATIMPLFLYSEDYGYFRRELPAWRDLYDDTILFLDGVIGQFYDNLKAAGALENTVFVVTSDHGEHLGEKGFYDHGYSLYNELIAIPLLIRYPDGFKRATCDERLTGLTDLYATILDLTQSPYPQPRHSYSLLSLEKRRSISSMNLYTRAHKAKLAKIFLHKPIELLNSLQAHHYALILDNNLKLLQKEDGSLSIYHLGKDPHEQMDLSDSLEPDLREEMRRLLMEDQKETGYLGPEILQ